MLLLFDSTEHLLLFQLFDLDPQGEEDEGANIDLDAQRQGKCAVIKTSTRQVNERTSHVDSIVSFHFVLDLFPSGHWFGGTRGSQTSRSGGQCSIAVVSFVS